MSSYWEATRRESRMTKRQEPLPDRAEVVIVGAGFTGLAAGYYLARQGVDVVVCEREHIGRGASGRNGGQVLPGWSLDMFQAVERFGQETAAMMWSVSEEALHRVRGLVDEEQIDCGLATVGHVEGTASAQGVFQLEQEWAAIRELSDRDVVLWDGTQIAQHTGALGYRAGIYDPAAMAFHPLDFVMGLAKAASRHGARIQQDTEVVGVHRDPGGTFEVVTRRGSVRADFVIFAANGFTPKFLHWVRARIIPVDSAQIAVQVPDGSGLPNPMPTVSINAPSFHYFRRAGERDLIFGGRIDDGDFRTLHRTLRDVIPALADAKLRFGWTGRIGISSDGMPHLVQLKNGAWSAAGFSGHGAALSTQMGWFLAQAVHQETPDARIHALKSLSWKRLPLRNAAAQGSLGVLKLSNPGKRGLLIPETRLGSADSSWHEVGHQGR